MRPVNRDRTPFLITATVGFLLGLLGTALYSSEKPLWRAPELEEMLALTRLEPIRALPRTEMVLVALEARGYLDQGRPYTAWTLLREHVDDEWAVASTVILAARAAGEWGGWHHTRRLLEGRGWLERAEGGEGLFLLGRASEEQGRWDEAVAAYRRYTALPAAPRRGLAQARLGRVLREADQPAEAAAAFAAAATSMAEVDDWMRTLEVEQLAEAGSSAAVSLATNSSGGSAPARLRRVEAEAEAWAASGDLERGIRRLEWESRVLRAQGAREEAARLVLHRAALLERAGQAPVARDLLRAVAFETTIAPTIRLQAAESLGEHAARSAAEELARSAAFEAAGKPGLAAKALRAALEQGAPDDAGIRLRLARLLYAERDHGPARAAFQRAAELQVDAELKAEAELYAARALYRAGGSRNEANAVAELRKVVERHEGTAAAGTAHFLLGDEAPSLKGALADYNRAAAVKHSPDAREALFRVGDRSLRLQDTAGAIAAWEEYVRRYPTGDQTARVAYEAGKLHERAGREAAARKMYDAATLADPVSYYALRAGNRLGVDPLERLMAEPRPWVGLAADAGEVAATLRRLELLEAAGLQAEWRQEYDAAVRAYAERPAALLALAEGLSERGYPLEVIRVGYRLLEKRGGQWDERLLRLVFPFPYREVLEREADRYDVDPMLLAGLVRQESTFRKEIRSRVGATGLGQIMPATGRWLAGPAGVQGYADVLLTVPEVNLRLAALYLGDLLARYDGARDLALSAYNAGPSRADRWRRELKRGRDTDAFREVIPFDETRHYVKVVLRNAAVYERLYGDPPASGIATPYTE